MRRKLDDRSDVGLIAVFRVLLGEGEGEGGSLFFLHGCGCFLLDDFQQKKTASALRV